MDTILTLASVPAILAIVQLLKNAGVVVGKWAALVSLALGIIFTLADYGFLGGVQTPAGWYGAVLAGVVLGLSASGVYEVAKTVGTSVANAQITAAQQAVAPVTSDGVVDTPDLAEPEAPDEDLEADIPADEDLEGADGITEEDVPAAAAAEK